MEHVVYGERWWVFHFLSLKESTQRGIIHEEGRYRLFSDEWLFSVEGWEALEAGKNNEISEQIDFYHAHSQTKQGPKESEKSLSLKILRIYWTRSGEPYLTGPDYISHRKVCWVMPYNFLMVKRFFFCSDEKANSYTFLCLLRCMLTQDHSAVGKNITSLSKFSILRKQLLFSFQKSLDPQRLSIWKTMGKILCENLQSRRTSKDEL